MKKILACLLIMLFPTTLFPVPAAGSEVSVGLFAQNLSNNRTRVQRDAFWSRHRGTRVTLDGRVTDVTPRGWILPMTVEMSTTQSNVSIACQIIERGERVAAGFNVGDRVRCEGTLRDYLLLFGGLSLTISDATVSR